jgi:acyl-[acyl-carrier-protein]-phospholipid O-acyltransferase/long-chain-fatty-acid--[acyl-carrier-protein] ligase
LAFTWFSIISQTWVTLTPRVCFQQYENRARLAKRIRRFRELVEIREAKPAPQALPSMTRQSFSIHTFTPLRVVLPPMTSTDSADARPVSPPRTRPAGLRGFWFLFTTQFQGAFSDNLYKFLVTYLIIGMGFSIEQRDQLVPVVSALFALPFILFSISGGYFADRYSKRRVAIWVKVAEICIMGLATVAFWLHSVPLMLAVVFLMSTQSAYFGPTKYGLLPELLPEKQLSWGNGVIGLGTYLSIIAGTVVAGHLSELLGERQVWSGAVLVGLACLGTLASTGISRLPAANPTKPFEANPLSGLATQLKLIRGDRVLFLAVLGSTFLWFLGALFQPTIIFYGKDILDLSDAESGYLQAVLAVGIGLGSVTAGYLSGKKIEYGLVPIGATGLTVFGLLLAWPKVLTPITQLLGIIFHAPAAWLAGERAVATTLFPSLPTGFSEVALGLFCLGASCGFYFVPISALIQHRPDPGNKGGVIAASNMLSFLGIFASAGVYGILVSWLRLTPPQVFLVASALTLAAAIYAYWLMPAAILRFILWLLTRTIYRIRVEGRDNIPERGGALFVCNHVSFVDALLLIAATDREVRFMMYKGTYERPYVKPFARILGIIPISSEQRPRDMLKSLQTASEAIKNGEVVCIFAEGQITRIGQMLPFRRGLERIMKDVDAPIVPVALEGVWGSIFSFEKRRFVWKLPHQFPYPVTVSFGKPLPANTPAVEVRQAVQELLADAWPHRRQHIRPLHRAFVRTARRHPRRFAMADLQTPRVSFGSALVRTVFLARRLRSIWAGQRLVGLLLPPSVPGALVNWAAMLCGKVPVNLNYTVSEQTLASCIQQCGIKTVLTSRTFLEKVKLKVACETVFLEDVVGAASNSRSADGPRPPQPGIESVAQGSSSRLRPGTPTLGEKLTAVFMAWLLPVRWLERTLGNDRKIGLDDLATVIFSSGSTGEPKGVMLSHYNIGSNIEQLEQVFGLGKRDGFLGILPFFHSFGFTGTLSLPAVLGVGVAYHPNPLDAKTIGPLISEYELTFLLATPTFLQIYMRGCDPADFGSLHVVLTGAEKLPERLANAFDEQFGIRPLEGYGCTECGPAVAVNTHDFRSAGFRQVGSKRGKIGHPLPGVSVRIVEAENPHSAPLPFGQPGLLLVRGPNVMQGYLGKPEKTAEVLIDATGSAGILAGELSASGTRSASKDAGAPSPKWYITGDIAALDEDGFLQITDRLSRFSKIGGEMVPHIKIEEKLHEFAGVTEQTFVVAGVPDEKKGERLVVLHKLPEERLQPTLEKLAQSDLPNLWRPKADDFQRVESFPLLGTGKLDLRKVKEVAMQLTSSVEARS